MTGVVIGTFEAENQAARAVSKLLQACVPSESVRTSLVPTRRFGTATRCSRSQSHLRLHRGGITVAVRTAGHVAQILALRVLREHGARDVGHTAVENVTARKPSPSTSAQYALAL